MVAPAVAYAIKGVIWYQGESNSRLAFAPMYAEIFPALIADWRAQWHEGDFPFLFVQIANFKSNGTEAWAVIREAQRRTLSVANTAMVVTIDIGDPRQRPSGRQTDGRRAPGPGRAGVGIRRKGGVLRPAVSPGNARGRGHARLVRSRGRRTWSPRAARSQGFEIAGDDGRFVAATARIDGKTVVAGSAQVAEPKYVRYGWANAPVINLYNSEGLPASPFTSEDAIPVP